jgi:hypothetical protein
MAGWGVKEVRAADGVASIKNVECHFAHGKHSYCDVHCGIMCEEGARFTHPGLEFHVAKAIGRGDAECLLIITNCRTVHSEAEIGKTLPLPRIEEEMRVNLVPNYLYWYWLFMLNGLEITLGTEGTMDALSERMKTLGMSHAKDFDNLNQARSKEELISEPLRRLTATVRKEGQDVIIEDCPFASHGGMACNLLHNFLDGVGEERGCYVEWTQQVPRGDESCRFRVNSRVPNEDDLVTLLKARLVRGEISFEEYEKIRRELDL